MAKLRMTYKNLKALRKSKEYQAMLVDLVASGVISKSKAEDLLGFNIPANLIGGTESSGTDDDTSSSADDSSSSADDSSSGADDSSSSADDSSSGADDSSSSSSGNTITITVSKIKTINDTQLNSYTVSSPEAIDCTQSIVVPAGSSGYDIYIALQAEVFANLTGLSSPSFTSDSVEHDVIGFNSDTAELFYTTDTFNEDTAIGVFILQASDSSGESEPESTPVVVPVKVSADSGEPITVGTYTIPSDWDDIDHDLTATANTYVFGNNFTPNENWTDDYMNTSIYYIAEPSFRDTNNDQVNWSTAISELPDTAYIAVILSSTSSSSSS